MEKVTIEQCEYVEDKVINGVLCFKLDGGWVEYSKEELTRMYVSEQGFFDAYVNRVLDECH